MENKLVSQNQQLQLNISEMEAIQGGYWGRCQWASAVGSIGCSIIGLANPIMGVVCSIGTTYALYQGGC